MQKIILFGLDQDKDKTEIVSINESCEFIGIEYVSAYANQRGLKVQVKHNSPDIREILSEKPNVVGLSVMASNYEHSKRFSQKLKNKNKNIKIVWGGPQATTYHDEVLKEGCVDYVVIGEGEKTFFNLANNLRNSQDPRSLEGIAFFDGEKVVKNQGQRRLTPEELDSIDTRLIHPTYTTFFAKQMPHSVPHSEMRFAMLVGSRGCWNDCSFCSSNSMWGRKIVYRSPQNIVSELEYLVKDKNVNFVFFGDDDFLTNQGWVRSIARDILKRGIHVKYHVMGSVRTASRFNDFDLLKKSGCCEITLGMETTNQKILDSIGKGYEISALPSVANEITSHGIHLGLYYMLGYPEQTKEDLEKDLNFIKRIPFSRIRAVFLTPYPGTRLYVEVERNNLGLDGCRNNWSMFTNDRPVIKSKVSPEELIEARKRILRLYFSEDYKERMRSMYEGDLRSEKAFDEFQSFIGEVI
ncbi:B12-binding domain-containing radical SAM protein [Nanoarchaeota archaeon]